jgi:hypothetical protein
MPAAKKIPALRNKFEARQTGQAEPVGPSCTAKPNSLNEAGGRVVLASAKYLKTPPPDPKNRHRNGEANPETERPRKSFGGLVGWHYLLACFIGAIYAEMTGAPLHTAWCFAIGLTIVFKVLAGGKK